MAEKKLDTEVLVIGGGPGGSIAALCLSKLGRDVTLLEKEPASGYQVGESLLPGTLSILSRLGVLEPVTKAGFPVKTAATFLWGDALNPWSFSLATPKTAPWVFDHALQVNRAEYDELLLKSAAASGVQVLEAHRVLSARWDAGDSHAELHWRNDNGDGVTRGKFIVDATGQRGLLAKKITERHFDSYYQNMACWSYFRGAKRFDGVMQGNLISEAFSRGWVWMIPLKDDCYSVGVITGMEDADRLRKLGKGAYFKECLDMCPQASSILAGATQVEGVRVTDDWSYVSSRFTSGRAFLCGDSACFIDPLFSQGVHLASYAGVLAAASIDYLLDHPTERKPVQDWYDSAYREAYIGYHNFVTGFYAAYKGKDNGFWRRRSKGGDTAIDDLISGAVLLMELGEHATDNLDDGFDPDQFARRRLAFAANYERTLQSIKSVHWHSGDPVLYPSYTMDPQTFRLRSCQRLGDEQGRVCSEIPMNESHLSLFAELAEEQISYRNLVRKLRTLRQAIPPAQLLRSLFDQGFIDGYDSSGEPVVLQSLPRFQGVGGENDLP